MSLSTLLYAAVVVVIAGDPGSTNVALEKKKTQNSTPCTTDIECSLNGVCISSLCVCDAPWSGPGCSILAFASTPPSGKNIYNGSDPRNTWGGAFAGPGEDGKFHAYVPLYRQGSLWHVETCMYGVADSPTGPWDWSSGAANFSCGINPQFLAFPNASNPSQTLYSLWERGAFWLSESLYGPFIAQRQGGYNGINPAPIFHNGSFFVTTQATKEIVTAPSYLGPWTHYSNITHPPTLPYIVEDPLLWIDKRGRWHIINHAYNTSEVGSCGSSHVSAHWFSVDGRDWHWSPQEPYGHTVTYQDGSMHTFATMERPYLHFDASTGSPDYLVLAVDLDASESCPLDERNRTQCCDCCKFSDHDGTTVIKLMASGPSSPGGPPPPPAGLVGGACTTDAQCSFNGQCVSGACSCDPAWRSSPSSPFACAQLNLLNPVRGTGLHTLEGGRNTSSWGGSALRDERTGLYHMFASQMVNHCGIATWTQNSHVVRATSATPSGAYTRVEAGGGGEVFPVFSHEPNAVRDPTTGEWALFFTRKDPSGRRVCNCSDGSSPPGCGRGGDEGPTVLSWAPAPEGPWSPPLVLLDMPGAEPDTNLAPLILPNGSLVGIWRTWGDGSCPHVRGGSCPHLVTAGHWKNASSYVFHATPLFPELATMGAEDPALYLDGRGNFHALFHNMDPCPDYPCPEVAGGHAFSQDGVTWVYTGVAYNSSGLYTDGTPFAFKRRERPHPVMGADGVTIVALTTGVNYVDASTAHGDATFTFLQPVATNSSSD